MALTHSIMWYIYIYVWPKIANRGFSSWVVQCIAAAPLHDVITPLPMVLNSDCDSVYCKSFKKIQLMWLQLWSRVQWRRIKSLDDVAKAKAPAMKEEFANLFREVMNFHSSAPFDWTPRINRLWWNWNLFYQCLTLLYSQLVKQAIKVLLYNNHAHKRQNRTPQNINIKLWVWV